jgi:hypothetical protein
VHSQDQMRGRSGLDEQSTSTTQQSRQVVMTTTKSNKRSHRGDDKLDEVPPKRLRTSTHTGGSQMIRQNAASSVQTAPLTNTEAQLNELYGPTSPDEIEAMARMCTRYK